MHWQTQSIYNALEQSGYDHDQMLVLADAIEEFDNDIQLANAYRWAAKNVKWPWKRSGAKIYKGRPMLWDWDLEGRSIGNPPIPEQGKLCEKLYRAMCDMNGKKYDSVNDAFVLLSRALYSTGLINSGSVPSSQGA